MKCKLKGVWIATVYNLDWPKSLDNIEKQKEEFINILENIKKININAVFVQVRPESDALYESRINPWSKNLTGVQGKNPGYDPLKFMIREAHKRNIEFHAWLNPYRITTNGTDLTSLCEYHPARLNPTWVLEYEDKLFYNPENKEVQNYIQQTISEIIRNYWVDGIHFDDYFYPYNYPLPQGEQKDGDIGNYRRETINNLIRDSYNTIKCINKNVCFGVSPFGVWKNKSSDILGSDTSNLESYYAVYADSLQWIYEQNIDYIAPQIYYAIDQQGSDYYTVLKWWDSAVNESEVKLYIGQGIYKEEIAKEIDIQIKMNSEFENVDGSIFFSYSNMENNHDVRLKISQMCREM